jgi:putative transposase
MTRRGWGPEPRDTDTGRVRRVAIPDTARVRFPRMAGVYAKLRVHVLWGTRGRRPWLDRDWRGRLFARIDVLAGAAGARLVSAGAARDHLHVYLELPVSLALGPLVDGLKAGTARWIQRTFPHRAGFAWQQGYAAFSVSPHEDARLLDDLRHQDTRHREHDFAREYLRLLEVNKVPYELGEALDCGNS